jgi:hypothetical protein
MPSITIKRGQNSPEIFQTNWEISHLEFSIGFDSEIVVEVDTKSWSDWSACVGNGQSQGTVNASVLDYQLWMQKRGPLMV